jgi:hypothetical protein
MVLKTQQIENRIAYMLNPKKSKRTYHKTEKIQ